MDFTGRGDVGKGGRDGGSVDLMESKGGCGDEREKEELVSKADLRLLFVRARLSKIIT